MSLQKTALKRLGNVANLFLNGDTKVIYQGFTGKQGTLNARDTIAYGTKVVGGVSPGKAGTHPELGLPVYNTVKEAKAHLNPHASAVFVPATLAAKAIEEAIENEIPLIVSVAEGMPAHDCLRIHQMLRTQQKSRLLGPNCPGILVPKYRCRIGLMPMNEFKPGTVGIMSRSGTLCYETVGATTKAGLGQSMVIGIGGDRTPGTTYVDALVALAEDPDTEGIILIGEVGGTMEFEALRYILDNKLHVNKPILTYFTGLCARENRTMGHAGAIQDRDDDGAAEKIRAYREKGIKVLDHIGYIGEEMVQLMADFNQQV